MLLQPFSFSFGYVLPDAILITLVVFSMLYLSPQLWRVMILDSSQLLATPFLRFISFYLDFKTHFSQSEIIYFVSCTYDILPNRFWADNQSSPVKLLYSYSIYLTFAHCCWCALRSWLHFFSFYEYIKILSISAIFMHLWSDEHCEYAIQFSMILW